MLYSGRSNRNSAPGAVFETDDQVGNKLNMSNILTKYVKESWEEMKKVTWPSKQKVVKDTIIVLAITIATAAFFGLIDLGLMTAFKKYLQVG